MFVSPHVPELPKGRKHIVFILYSQYLAQALVPSGHSGFLIGELTDGCFGGCLPNS